MPDIEIDELLKEACEFQGLSMQSRERSSVEYRKKETDAESYIRIVIDGLMVRLAQNMKEKIKDTNEKISYQISLSASYVRTHFIINDMVLRSDLIEANTLIRKQLESLTRLHELDAKPLQKLMSKTPNVINTFKEMGKQAYPHLSEIAHFASPKAGELLHVMEKEGDLIGPSMIPVYTDAAHGCFDMQALVSFYFLFWFIGKQRAFYEAFDGEAEEKLLLSAFQAAINADVIRVDGVVET
ncbi:hypothetical protein OAM69_05170 [bacterium]|nr:hypothetical protein [bacterium]